MALIQTIRSKFYWVLMVLIGLGLAGFLLMDFGGNGMRGMEDQFTLGEVGDNVIDNREFQMAEQYLYGNSSVNNYEAKKSLWDWFVEKTMIKEEAGELGIGVAEEELESMLYGPDYSPVIRQQFTNRQTGQFDQQGLQQFRQAIESGDVNPEQERYWNYFSSVAQDDRIQSKVLGLVSKSVYTPSWYLEKDFSAQNEKADIAYVRIPFSEIPAGDFTVNDGEIKEYAMTHSSGYMRDEETRVAEYVLFEVTPTDQDIVNLEREIDSLKSQFAVVERDSSFALLNRGSYLPYYYMADELDTEVRDSLFEAANGSVLGPYVKDGEYKIVKLVDRKIIPDSVNVRHIMISADGRDQATVLRADNLIDSLKNLVDNGVHSFDSLVTAYSQDGSTKDKNGEFGYAPQVGWSAEADRLARYFGEEGKTYKVYSQFGVHLIEIVGRKYVTNTEGVRLGIITLPIVPSQETQDAAEQKANDLLFNHADIASLKKAIDQDPSLSVEQSEAFGRNDFTFGPLGQSLTSRNIIKWMFEKDAKTGFVAPEVYGFNDPERFYSKYFVLAGLKEIREPGLPDVNSLRADLEPILMNKKKGESIVSSLAGKTMSSVANKYNSQVDSATVSFSGARNESLTTEPTVLAKAMSLKAGESATVVGNSGVYMIRCSDKKPVTFPGVIPQMRMATTNTLRSSIPQAVIDDMRKGAEVVDNRSRFF